MDGLDLPNSPSPAVQSAFQKAAGDSIAERIEAIALEVRGISGSDAGIFASSETLSTLAYTLQQTRRKIDEIFELEGFAVSAACDVMLELFQARVRGAPVPLSALCQAMSCSSSVTRRWVDALESMQLVEKLGDDTETQKVGLTEKGYLRTAKVLQLHL